MDRNLKQADVLGLEGQFLNVYAGTGNILLIFLSEAALQGGTAPSEVSDSGSVLSMSECP